MKNIEYEFDRPLLRLEKGDIAMTIVVCISRIVEIVGEHIQTISKK